MATTSCEWNQVAAAATTMHSYNRKLINTASTREEPGVFDFEYAGFDYERANERMRHKQHHP